MMDISKGRYWDRPWSLVDGCTPCSPGCDHCWSAAMAHHYRRTKALGQDSKGIPIYTDDRGNFTGKIVTHPDRLDIPLKRRKPTVYAVWNDLFHENVPDDFILKTFRTIGAASDHIYLILTKRPQRMLDVINRINPALRADGRAHVGSSWECVYFGLTVCNQPEADKKIPEFLKVPGKKFLSIEPMLGAMNIKKYLLSDCAEMCPEGNECSECGSFRNNFEHKLIDAVILGGETGAGARPMHPDWVRSIRDQCAAAGVDFFLKSGMGKRKNYYSNNIKEWGNLNNELWSCLEDNHIGNYPLWRLLDGRTHDDLPCKCERRLK